ncbi:MULTISPECIES: histidine kinase [unclassified Mesorhizobium]|uniref:GAF domain-containing sensor histidine kinase n=1 Tax=unclassified Mesorhizobium TaxID=325217 RepID=UPI000FCB6325|nr:MULTISPECIES: histidine kinase [unclassified Mesorhizobium]TGP22104.1 GAF domain-containing protein [Mesorhizobium sp. M1D.F.Ca.ET.231.01.1.1]TGP30489.1 GAF domain-containing protein [Mesorhizobium sp. M1D.F.Ca.ET.234.01.1.1]TGS44565.1 GAF domain-containing protein [Mesorhizobium sp. M1D.F.Ca.ET.184.01.1.1]TGS60605.1 GAF domain-containing protein [Mesorhizobium sp. M1D.F.Ca.ET.183.01.1.1]
MSEVSPQLIDRLLAISRALAGHIDPGSAFRATAIEIGTLIPHDHIDLAVLSLDGRMHACYEAGFHTSWSDLAQHPVDGSPIRRVLRGETPYLLSGNALIDDRFHFEGAFDGPIFAAKLRSRIIVPLRARGSVIGALNISRHEAGCYTQEDVEIAQQCADLIGPYIFALIQTEEARRAMLAESEARNRAELLRVGASQLTEGMERERRRMAMDLHDQTLADLARIARQVSAFRSRGVARTAQLADLEQEVAGCLAELRHIVDDMRPSVLELFGLRDAVEAHLNRSVARAKPPIAVRIADTSDGSADSLSETLRTALYRIVQEAINNAVRHAGPSRIEVQLASTPGTFSVTVCDDGHGCGTVDPAAQGGIGHMHTRAALVGARLRFEPAGRKGGTRVVIEIDREPTMGKGSTRTVALAGQSVAEAI